MRNTLLVAAAVSLVLAGAAQAHVELTVTGLASPGSTNLYGFAPGHGCGTEPTTVMRIAIPATIESVKPVAKPGWNIDIVRNAEGTIIEIAFTGGSLPNDWWDQFWIRGRINAEVHPHTLIYFPVIQRCPSGGYDWINLPGADGVVQGDPAPRFEVHEAVGEAAAEAHAH